MELRPSLDVDPLLLEAPRPSSPSVVEEAWLTVTPDPETKLVRVAVSPHQNWLCYRFGGGRLPGVTQPSSPQ